MGSATGVSGDAQHLWAAAVSAAAESESSAMVVAGVAPPVCVMSAKAGDGCDEESWDVQLMSAAAVSAAPAAWGRAEVAHDTAPPVSNKPVKGDMQNAIGRRVGCLVDDRHLNDAEQGREWWRLACRRSWRRDACSSSVTTQN